mmetsp:Transcript_1032/g.1661  ORF Transcript_1032/g.1661 Transcript_1032/m.1661 type:complete len:837 (+) Transcript_1032:83-2593(+)
MWMAKELRAFVLFFPLIAERGEAQGSYEAFTLSGTPNYPGSTSLSYQDGSLMSATYSLPREVRIFDNETLFISDTGSMTIRKVRMLEDEVTTIAYNLNAWGLHYRNDVVYATDRGVTPRIVSVINGNVTTVAGYHPGCDDGFGYDAQFRQPGGLAYDAAKDVFYLADTGCRAIRQVSPAGDVTTVVGSLSNNKFQDGPPDVAGFRTPKHLVYTGDFLYVNDDTRVRKIDVTTRVTTTLVGSPNSGIVDGFGTSATFIELDGLTYFEMDEGDAYDARLAPNTNSTTNTNSNSNSSSSSSSGRNRTGMLVSIHDNKARLINTLTREVTSIAGSGLTGYQDGFSPSFDQPYGVSARSDGKRMYIVDKGNNRIAMLQMSDGVVEAPESDGPDDESNAILIAVVVIGVATLTAVAVACYVVWRRRNRDTDSRNIIVSSHALVKQSSFFGSVPLIDANDVKIIEKRGEGNFGTLYKAKLKDIMVALKIPKHCNAFSTDDVRELNALMDLRKHPNLLDFIGVVSIKKKACVMTAFCEKGSLDKLHHKIDMVQEKRFLEIVRDVCSGLQALHEIDMIHRDVACRNLLMKSDGVVVIADYGLTQKMSENKDYYVQHTSTLPWAWTAPEAIRTRRFTRKSDVYSTGVAFWEILTRGRYPYGKPDVSIMETHPAKRIALGELKLEIPKDIEASQFSRQIVQSCLAFSPEDRPPVSELLRRLHAKGYPPNHFEGSPGSLPPRGSPEGKDCVSSPSSGCNYKPPLVLCEAVKVQPVDADTAPAQGDAVRRHNSDSLQRKDSSSSADGKDSSSLDMKEDCSIDTKDGSIDMKDSRRLPSSVCEWRAASVE